MKKRKHLRRRWRFLETFTETHKRNLEENPGSSTSSLKKRSCSTGSDVVTYLKEMRSQKERETELESAQQDLRNLQQQQMRHQQEQAQQLIQQQQLQVQIQQQQMNAFLSVLSKFAEK